MYQLRNEILNQLSSVEITYFSFGVTYYETEFGYLVSYIIIGTEILPNYSTHSYKNGN